MPSLEIACAKNDWDPSSSMFLLAIYPAGRTLCAATVVKNVVASSGDPGIENNGEDRPLE